MCGIAGFLNDKIDREKVIQKMNRRMLHRGPDAGGYWLDPQTGWTIGHRRLSILDLNETGAQPMLSKSQRYVISYNGEIYNIAKIKKRLDLDGYKIHYRGTSDTEVLVEAIEAYGILNTITLCKGMFAIAIYDRKNQILSLIRDRAGEKPLYYGYISNEGDSSYFAFASDLALFRVLPGFNNEINRDALAEYMLYNYIPAPMSIYKGIYKLEPGSILTLKPPYINPGIHKYWSMIDAAKRGEYNRFAGSEKEASKELEKLLRNAISEQMIADVPLGAFLSGGIDSSTIVSLMQDMSNTPIKTFTIGFDDIKYNEADYARDISNYLGTDHTEIIITESEMQKSISEIAYFFSEPFGDASMIPTLFVSKIARSKVTVSLSGDAGDELFCGYDGYWKSEYFWRKIQKCPKIIKRMVAGLIRPLDCPSERNFHRILGCLDSSNICQLKDVVFNRKNYCSEHIVLGAQCKKLSGVQQYLNDNICAMELQDMLEYHPDDILVKVDRAGMAISLENRIPMLDKDVLEFSWCIPSKYKYSDGISKKVLRNILYQYVPQKIMDRPKQGFCIPLEKWLMQGEINDWAEELMSNNKLSIEGFFDKNMVKYIWKRFKKDKSMTRIVWNILMAEQWFREYENRSIYQ